MHAHFRQLLQLTLALLPRGQQASSSADGEIPNSEMASILHRPIRAISYPSSSNMGVSVTGLTDCERESMYICKLILSAAAAAQIFIALAVPLEDPANSVSLSYFFEANYGLPTNETFFGDSAKATTTAKGTSRRKRAIDRTTVYAVLQNKFQR